MYPLAMPASCGIEHPISTVTAEEEIPRNRPLVIYDGDCGFCVNVVKRWLMKGKEKIDVMPFQTLGTRLPEVDQSACAKAVHLVDENGIFRAAQAVLRIRAHLAGKPPGVFLPVVAFFLQPGYWLVAHNRGLANRLVFGKGG